MKRSIIFFFILMLIPIFSWATNYYVRKGGSGSGTSWSSPWNDFNNISGLSAGDTVYVAAGTYTGAYTFMASGTSDSARITIKRATVSEHGSDTGWSAGYDGTVTINAQTGTGATFDYNDKSYITVNGVDRTKFLMNGGKNKQYGASMATSTAHGNKLLNVTISYYSHKGIYVYSNKGDLEIAYNDIHHNGDDLRFATASHNFTVFTNDGTYGWNNIHHNKIHEAGNNPNPHGFEDNVELWGVNLYVNFYNNEVYHTYAQGCQESSKDNLLVSGNYVNVYNNLLYVDSASCTTQTLFVPATGTNHDILIYNNVIYKPPSGGAFGIFIGTDGAGDYWNNVSVYNNTIYGFGYPIYISETNYPNKITNVIVKNNILRSGTSSNAGMTLIQSSLSGDVTADYNYYDTTLGGSDIYLWGTFYNVTSPPQGYEAHGARGNPEYNSIGTTGFQMKSSSPTSLKEQGTVLNSIFATDKNGITRGSMWSMGAYEDTNQNLASTPIPNPPSNIEIR